MRPASWVLVVVLLALGGQPAHAQSEDDRSTYRVVIDRVDLEPAAIGGQRLRVFVSALSLQGQLLDLTDPKSIKVIVGASEIREPFALGTYANLEVETAIVIVVQANLQYAEVLPVIAEAVENNVLAALGEGRTQFAVLPYGESLSRAKLAPLKHARSKLAEVQSDGTAGEPALLDALERALAVLKKAKTEPEGRSLRKMIVVIGDGRDLSGDRDRVTRLGERAAKEGVRIHSFAFSPTDVRRPLLLLGELSKRSLGTFRWVRSESAGSWAPAFQQLRDEINQQYVLTYFLPKDTDVAGRKLKVVTSGRVETASLNEVKIPELSCVGEPCAGYCTGTRCAIPRAGGGRGVLGWLLLIAGILVGVLVVLGVIGYVLTKRQQAAVAFPQVPLPPGSLPPAVQAKFPSKPPKIASVPPASVPPPPAMITGPRFYFLTGPHTGLEIALKHGFTIGKQPGSDLVIDDGYTSTTHAQVGMDHFGNCSLYDRGSTNGTFVNGVRVTEYALEHGNTVRIGSTELRFLAQ